MVITLFSLTGGIACGKSTVADLFRVCGVPVIDADHLARQLVEPGSNCLHNITSVFGSDVLTSDGHLDRKKLGSIVFSDRALRKRLETILHPAIDRAVQQQAERLQCQGHQLAAYEAALLVETGKHRQYRPVVVVVTDEAVQVQRLIQRDRLSHEQAMKRIGSQLPLTDKAAIADYVIDTTCSMDHVRSQALQVLKKICKKTNVDPSAYDL